MPTTPGSGPVGDPTKVPPTNDGSIPTRSNGGDPNKPGDKNTPSGNPTKEPPTNDGSIPTRSSGGDPNKPADKNTPSGDPTKVPPTNDGSIPTKPNGGDPSKPSAGQPVTDTTAIPTTISGQKPTTARLQVPTRPECDKWSDYFNIGDPSVLDGDTESISKLLQIKDFCNKPGDVVTSVDCRFADHSKYPWTSGNQVGVVCDLQVCVTEF